MLLQRRKKTMFCCWWWWWLIIETNFIKFQLDYNVNWLNEMPHVLVISLKCGTRTWKRDDVISVLIIRASRTRANFPLKIFPSWMACHFFLKNQFITKLNPLPNVSSCMECLLWWTDEKFVLGKHNIRLASWVNRPSIEGRTWKKRLDFYNPMLGLLSSDVHTHLETS